MSQIAVHNVVSITVERHFYNAFNMIEYVATDEDGRKTTFMAYSYDDPIQVVSLPDVDLTSEKQSEEDIPDRIDAAPDYRTAEQYYADLAHEQKRKHLAGED
jgi:hypothetical protein